jgi:hypothetical protein
LHLFHILRLPLLVSVRLVSVLGVFPNEQRPQDTVADFVTENAASHDPLLDFPSNLGKNAWDAVSRRGLVNILIEDGVVEPGGDWYPSPWYIPQDGKIYALPS